MKHTIIIILIASLILPILYGCGGESARERKARIMRERSGSSDNDDANSVTENDNNNTSTSGTSELKIAYPSHKTYTFDLGKEAYELKVPFDEDLMEYFANEPKVYRYTSTELPKDWETDYYNMFVDNDKDVPYLREIIRQLKRLQADSDENYTIVEWITAFVQGGIDYDWNSYFSVSDKLNYPFETLFKQKGVCSDKSLLLGKLLSLQGYEVVFMAFENANHMAVGLGVPNEFGNFSTTYAFVESTNYSIIGEVPEKFVGGISINEAPQLIPVNNSADGRSFKEIATYLSRVQRLQNKYGKSYPTASAEVKVLLEEIETLESSIDALKKDIQDCKGQLSSSKARKCRKNQKQLNRKIDQYNDKVAKYNELNAERPS